MAEGAQMKVMMIGDVVGGPGRRMLKRELARARAEHGIGAVVVNAENCAAGSGITAALAQEIFEAGADAITLRAVFRLLLACLCRV